MIFQKKYFSCYALLTEQISLPDCLYFLRYWSVCVLQLSVNQVVTLWILKLTYLSNHAVFRHDRKFKTKNQILWEREKYLRWKAFLSILKGLSVSKNFLRLENATLIMWNSTFWSRLKLTVQIQLALHLCDPFFINNRNMTGNIVEK